MLWSQVGRSRTGLNPGVANPGLPTLLPTPAPAHSNAGVSKAAAGQHRWTGYLCRPSHGQDSSCRRGRMLFCEIDHKISSSAFPAIYLPPLTQAEEQKSKAFDFQQTRSEHRIV